MDEAILHKLERRFIDHPVAVKVDSNNLPMAIFIDGHWYDVTILLSWQDHGFAAGTHKFTWQGRQHRNYYHVRDSGGKVWEIYLDRAGTARTWQLFAEVLTAGEGQ